MFFFLFMEELAQKESFCCTYQLKLGEVPLPPEVLLHLGSETSQEVVGVHDDVDKVVEQNRRRRLLGWKSLTVRLFTLQSI